jgi:hypothetical protein
MRYRGLALRRVGKETRMKSTLWNVVHDEARLAVVSAPTEGEAWDIVRALQNLNDLPINRCLALEPCDRRTTAKVRSTATRARLTEGFIACLGGGMFITWLAGRGPDPRECAA